MDLRSVLVLGVGVVAMSVGVAAGQDGAPAEPDPLAGPRVGEVGEAERPSIVRRAFDGLVRRLEVSPEEAALERLSLDADEAERVTEILGARHAQLDQIFVRNIELVLRYQAASAADDKLAIVGVLVDLWRVIKPLRDRGTLRDELASVLSESHLASLDAMVGEYDGALLAEARSVAEAAGERFREGRWRFGENLQRLGVELKRSYERAIVKGVEEYEALLARLRLAPEHEREVRRIVQDYAQATMFKPTPEQQRQLMFDLFGAISPDEQVRLVRELLGRGE